MVVEPDRPTVLASPVFFSFFARERWEMLPQELGCGSGVTCWWRLRDWQEAGIWQLTHFAMLDWLSRFGQIDW